MCERVKQGEMMESPLPTDEIYISNAAGATTWSQGSIVEGSIVSVAGRQGSRVVSLIITPLHLLCSTMTG
jgi:hypothetical protein